MELLDTPLMDANLSLLLGKASYNATYIVPHEFIFLLLTHQKLDHIVRLTTENVCLFYLL